MSRPEDDDLLGDCHSAGGFSQMRTPSRASGHMLAAPRKSPNGFPHGQAITQARFRERTASANSAKQASSSGFWFCLVLGFLAFGGYGMWTVPSQERTLSNFESKLTFIGRALGGQLEKENRGLQSQMQAEKRKEMELNRGEDALRKQLKEEHEKETVLQERLAMKESSYKSAQQDIIKTQSGLQNWHKKSDELKSRLALVQTDAKKKVSDLQRAHQETAKVERQLQSSQRHEKQLQSSLASAQTKNAGLDASSRKLRGQLDNELHWHKDTMAKFRRYKEAETNLVKSIDFEA